MCWYAHRKPYILHDTMVKRMIELTSNSSDMHGVVDDNSNPFKNIVMDAMRISQGNAGQYPIVDEEPNLDPTKFFDLLKDFDEPLLDDCTNHSKLLTIAQVFTIKSDFGLSKTNYDIIILWARNILPKGNILKENFYTA